MNAFIILSQKMEKEIEMLKNLSLTESLQKTQCPTTSIEIELEEDFDWNGFEFIPIKKVGPVGSMQAECLDYYKK